MMMCHCLNFVLGEYFWELLGEVLFFTPNNFWQAPTTRIFGLYFLGTLGDVFNDPATSV